MENIKQYNERIKNELKVKLDPFNKLNTEIGQNQLSDDNKKLLLTFLAFNIDTEGSFLINEKKENCTHKTYANEDNLNKNNKNLEKACAEKINARTNSNDSYAKEWKERSDLELTIPVEKLTASQTSLEQKIQIPKQLLNQALEEYRESIRDEFNYEQAEAEADQLKSAKKTFEYDIKEVKIPSAGNLSVQFQISEDKSATIDTSYEYQEFEISTIIKNLREKENKDYFISENILKLDSEADINRNIEALVKTYTGSNTKKDNFTFIVNSGRHWLTVNISEQGKKIEVTNPILSSDNKFAKESLMNVAKKIQKDVFKVQEAQIEEPQFENKPLLGQASSQGCGVIALQNLKLITQGSVNIAGEEIKKEGFTDGGLYVPKKSELQIRAEDAYLVFKVYNESGTGLTLSAVKPEDKNTLCGLEVQDKNTDIKAIFAQIERHKYNPTAEEIEIAQLAALSGLYNRTDEYNNLIYDWSDNQELVLFADGKVKFGIIENNGETQEIEDSTETINNLQKNVKENIKAIAENAENAGFKAEGNGIITVTNEDEIIEQENQKLSSLVFKIDTNNYNVEVYLDNKKERNLQSFMLNDLNKIIETTNIRKNKYWELYDLMKDENGLEAKYLEAHGKQYKFFDNKDYTGYRKDYDIAFNQKTKEVVFLNKSTKVEVEPVDLDNAITHFSITEKATQYKKEQKKLKLIYAKKQKDIIDQTKKLLKEKSFTKKEGNVNFSDRTLYIPAKKGDKTDQSNLKFAVIKKSEKNFRKYDNHEVFLKEKHTNLATRKLNKASLKAEKEQIESDRFLALKLQDEENKKFLNKEENKKNSIIFHKS